MTSVGWGLATTSLLLRDLAPLGPDPSDGALGALRLALALRASWPPAAAGSKKGDPAA